MSINLERLETLMHICFKTDKAKEAARSLYMHLLDNYDDVHIFGNEDEKEIDFQVEGDVTFTVWDPGE